MVSLLSVSCAGPSPRERQQERLLARLDSSNQAMREIVHSNTDALISNMKNDSYQSGRLILERVQYWLPILQQIEQHALTANKQINRIANSINDNHTTSYDTLAKALYLQLLHFKKEVLNMDIEIFAHFKNTVMPEIDITKLDTIQQIETFGHTYFDKINGPHANVSLQYWLNVIALAEHQLTQYCYTKTLLGCNLGMEYSHLLISQSSSSVGPGETLNIFAGVGSFSAKAAPKIKINGHKVATEQGVAHYQLRGSSKKGEHSILVEVTYLDPNGIAVTENKTIEYTVR
jgi:hypothetical protein